MNQSAYYIDRDLFETPDELAQLFVSPHTFYWSDDWSPEFYVASSLAGMISTGRDQSDEGAILLAEMQDSYAVLDWERLHLSRSFTRWQKSAACQDRRFRLCLRHDLHEVAAGIGLSHPNSWLIPRYIELLKQIRRSASLSFDILTPGLLDGDGRLVAGEIGYAIRARLDAPGVYTSLTGFFDRSRKANANTGTLQLALLARELQQQGFAFWNLGQYCPELLQYKISLGAIRTPRLDFLTRWFESTGMMDLESPVARAWRFAQDEIL